MRKLPTTVLLLALLAGCQAGGSVTLKPSGTKPTAAASPAAKAPALKLAAPSKLAKPASGTVVLSGRVKIDPAYAVEVKAASIISTDGASVLAGGTKLLSPNGGTIISTDGASIINQDGASIISEAGGGIISTDGASLISPDGASIVAQGAGNVVAPASIISQDGGSIISTDGASIINQDGASIISTDGSSIISTDGASLKKRALFATGTAHAQRAAAGMAVYARSLVTHKPLPVGQDKDGNPVYAVYTNLKGDYELYLPKELQDNELNVEVVAFVPGKPDTRLHLQEINPAAAVNSAIDEDTTVVVNFLRFAFRQFALRILQGDAQGVKEFLHLDELALPAPVQQRLDLLLGEVRNRGLDKLADPGRRYRLADRITDIVMAHLQLDAATANLLLVPPDNHYLEPRPTERPPSKPLLARLEAERRAAVAPFIDDLAWRAHLATAPFVRDGLAALAQQPTADGSPAKPFEFLHPNDYDTFLAAALQVGKKDPTSLPKLMADYDAAAGVTVPAGSYDWYSAAMSGVFHEFGVVLFSNQQAYDELVKLFDESKQP